MTTIFPREKWRWLTHLALMGVTSLWCLATDLAVADKVALPRMLAIGTGYLSLIFLAASLIIGPLELLWHKRRRRNPVNISLRRDIGIWTGLVGLAHVWFGFQAHLSGQIVLFFFEETARGLKPLVTPFGAGNYFGAAATIIMVFLLFLSNDVALRWLRGPVWKNLQRLNYILFPLVIVHTIVYQVLVKRDTTMRTASYLLMIAAIGLQLAGLYAYRSRSRRLEST